MVDGRRNNPCKKEHFQSPSSQRQAAKRGGTFFPSDTGVV